MDEKLTLLRPALRVGVVAGLAAAVFAAALAAASAQTPALPRGAEKASDAVRPLLGSWDLELVGQPRKCTLTFGAEEAAQGRQLRFPATCRRALPILAGVAAWSVAAGGQPQLLDAQGKGVLVFSDGGAAIGRVAKGQDGSQYRLDPKGYARVAGRAPPNAAETAAQAAQRPTVVDAANAPALEAIPGRYGLMRQANREACRLMVSAGGTSALEAGCQDTGLTIFDPVGWRYAAGRLSLVARRGHSVDLVFEGGRWRKDPAVGAPLMMKKLP